MERLSDLLLCDHLIIGFRRQSHLCVAVGVLQLFRVGFSFQSLAHIFLLLRQSGDLIFAFVRQSLTIKRFQFFAGFLLFAYRRLPRRVLFRELLEAASCTAPAAFLVHSYLPLTYQQLTDHL